ncbi:DUF5993 family protein (plasmid) [Streptoverticillium reticulum]|uniref:DUF5993 family protein n=1 Tax=Streptoverticillium reticulum TaxID=1433415 RepID=UPI0039BF5906
MDVMIMMGMTALAIFAIRGSKAKTFLVCWSALFVATFGFFLYHATQTLPVNF